MIRSIYNLITLLANALVWIPALFNEKLKLGVNGRKETFGILQSNIKSSDRVIWMHVASLGEFEQGRPVLERLKIDYPNHKILLSFFSPSGYVPRQNYEQADVVCYLPLDTQQNAKRFLELAHPELVIFVKYEFWPNYLNQIKLSDCKSILISTAIQKDNKILKYNTTWFREMMNAFDHILTQDQSTYDLLVSLNLIAKIKVSGDTRIDRTLSIAKSAEELPAIKQFCGNSKVLVAGSTWREDESLLMELLKRDHFKDWKLIMAPHDVMRVHTDMIMNHFTEAVGYSTLDGSMPEHRVLIIDNIGLLNKIYRYGHIAYIGGGFGSGIHNTLEPAAFNLPIIIGPKYEKFVEAKALVESGGAFTISNELELIHRFSELLSETNYSKSSGAVETYMQTNKGATVDVMTTIQTLIQ